jgi:para-nitrobenzyl esterase
LRALPAERFIEGRGAFRPVERDGYVLPDTVHAIFEAGRQNRAPVMAGVNAKEERTFRVTWPAPQGENADPFSQFYISADDPRAANDTNLWRMWKWAELNRRTTGDRSYVYVFSHSPPQQADPDRNGPIHGAEKAYVFGNLSAQYDNATAEDESVSDLMSAYWTNFAKSGDPNGEGLSEWPALAADDVRIMNFSGAPRAQPLAREDALMFLDSHFARLRAANGAIQR